MADLAYRAVQLLPDPEATHIIVGEFDDIHYTATKDNPNGVVAFCDSRYWADKIVEALNK